MDACYLPSLSCALALFGVEVFTLRQWFFRVSCKWVRNVKLSPNPCPETLAWPSFQMMGGTRWGLQGLEELPIPGEYRFRKGEREVLGFIKKVELLVRRLIDWTENETNSLDSLTELIPSQRDYVWAGSSTFGKSEQKGPRGTFPFWLEFFFPQNPWLRGSRTYSTECVGMLGAAFHGIKREKTQAKTCLPTSTRAETSGHVQLQMFVR